MTIPQLPNWSAVAPGTPAATTLLRIFGSDADIVGEKDAFTLESRRVIIRPTVQRDAEKKREIVVLRGYLPSYDGIPELAKSELFVPSKEAVDAGDAGSRRIFCTSANRLANGWLELELNDTRG